MKKISTLQLRKAIMVYILISSVVNTYSQNKNIAYDRLTRNDSVRVQTYTGIYYYGSYINQNDSILLLSTINNVFDSLKLSKSQIVELEIIKRETKQEQATLSPMLEKAKKEGEFGTISPPKSGTMIGQVAAGTGGLISGALGGAIAGAFIAGSVTGDWKTASLNGAGYGALAGSMLLSSYLIYAKGNTPNVKGKYYVTLGGVVLGTVGSLVFPPLLLVAPSLVGTLFYNSTRHVVAKPLTMRALPPQPNFNQGVYGVADLVFQTNVVTITF